MAVEKRKIVHEFDLLKILGTLNLRTRLENGNMQCDWCRTVIKTPSDIALLKKEEGKIKICCSHLDCIYKSQRSENK